MSKRPTDSLPPIDAALAREIAVDASCDPRTILAVASGREVRGLAGIRARKALADAAAAGRLKQGRSK